MEFNRAQRSRPEGIGVIHGLRLRAQRAADASGDKGEGGGGLEEGAATGMGGAIGAAGCGVVHVAFAKIFSGFQYQSSI